jgi:hypothetical protein
LKVTDVGSTLTLLNARDTSVRCSVESDRLVEPVVFAPVVWDAVPEVEPFWLVEAVPEVEPDCPCWVVAAEPAFGRCCDEVEAEPDVEGC